MDPDLDAPATKRDLVELEAKLEAKFEAKFESFEERMKREMDAREERMTLTLAGEIARSANAVIEQLTATFRAGDDRTSAVGDRVTDLETRVDEHVANAAVHRRARR